jgi:3-oxoacyl-[acyl-carrier protein] reductase
MVAEGVEKLGGLDILVHNAGGGTVPSSVQKLEDDAIAHVINANLSSCLWLTRAALPHLRQAEAGRILFTSSIAGNRRSMPGFSHYAAAKSGVNGFARNLALELARSGITVNVVEPGPTRIERWDAVDAEELARQAAEIPAGRFGTPAEVASAMLFFASREADYVTGQFLTLDGGLSLGALPPSRSD